MTAEVPQRGGFVGFLSTIPGIITAFAGLITAMVGLYQIGPAPASNSAPPSVDVQADAVPDEFVDPIDVAPDVDPDLGVGDAATQLIDECAAGVLASCADLLDLLTDECYAGFFASCDALYFVSPVGSAYENYGATCGGREASWDYAGFCEPL